METNSSVLAWRIPGTGEPGGLPSMGCTSRTRLKRLSSSSVFSYSYLQSLFPFLSATDQSVEVHQPHPLWNPNISSVSLLSIEADQVRIRKQILWVKGKPSSTCFNSISFYPLQNLLMNTISNWLKTQLQIHPQICLNSVTPMLEM